MLKCVLVEKLSILKLGVLPQQEINKFLNNYH